MLCHNDSIIIRSHTKLAPLRKTLLKSRDTLYLQKRREFPPASIKHRSGSISDVHERFRSWTGDFVLWFGQCPFKTALSIDTYHLPKWAGDQDGDKRVPVVHPSTTGP